MMADDFADKLPRIDSMYDLVLEFISAQPYYVVLLYPGAINMRPVAVFQNYLQARRLSKVFQEEGVHSCVERFELPGLEPVTD